jgi:L-asparaginase/Glu-tRNA(Gln) amidotransferase subunit D
MDFEPLDLKELKLKTLDTGYSILVPKDNSIENKVNKEETFFSQDTKKASETVLINCGGTIVSLPDEKSSFGVTPRDLPLSEIRFLKKLDISYVKGVLKLSQNYNEKDLLLLDQIIAQNRRFKFIIVTIGTDNIAALSTWLDLVAKKYNVKILVLASQRSLDKPTSDFRPLVTKFYNRGRSFPSGNCLIAIRTEDGSFELHSPYQIRKYDSYAKKSFYSQTVIYISKKKDPKDYRSLKNTLDKHTIVLTSSKINIEIQSFFQKYTGSKNTIVLASGLGNVSKEGALKVYSKCPVGPVNRVVYGHLPEKKSLFSSLKEITSWESLEMVLNACKFVVNE